MSGSQWTIIYTDHLNSYPHLEHLKYHNPSAQIILADISHGITEKSYAWRNCDYLIRLWLQQNATLIQYNKIAILEWDALITQQLPDININGLVVKHKHIPNANSQWQWFQEIDRLGIYKQNAIGIAPLAVMFMNKVCIQTWLDKEFDDLYRKDIFCELRLPTILNSKHISISEYDMPCVWHIPIDCKIEQGIYHPIKNEIPLATFKNRS